jgi:uncharacterized membrane protein YphA (DoxX/SURF4 family)
MDLPKHEDVELLTRKRFRVWENDYVLLATRLFLGVLFVIASIDKIADPNAFAVSIGYYKLVEATTALTIATVLPWIELVCGLFLIFGIMVRGSSLLILLMVVAFTAGVISGIVRGLDISCGCFTRDPNVDKIGWLKVAENCGLMVLSVLLLFSSSDRFSITATFTQSSNTSINDK